MNDMDMPKESINRVKKWVESNKSSCSSLLNSNVSDETRAIIADNVLVYTTMLELIKRTDQAEKLAAALEDCANDLEAEINHQYPEDVLKWKTESRRRDRDMVAVIQARAALKAYREGE